MFRLALAVILVTSCAFDPSGEPAGGDDTLIVDGIRVSAASADPPGEPGPLNVPCIPTANSCVEGFTCRLRTATTGLCRPVAGGAPGDACEVDDHCGANMTCIEPSHVCAVVCSTAAPAARCGALRCVPVWSAAVGICELP